MTLENPPRLRAARTDDADVLWLWANDAETRRGSHGRAEIAWDAHVEWLRERLSNPFAVVFIAEAQKQPIGSVRFDTTDQWQTARLSYVVAPESRGRGLAAAIVAEGVTTLRGAHSRVGIFADVSLDNERSLKVFRRLAWRETLETTGNARFWLD